MVKLLETSKNTLKTSLYKAKSWAKYALKHALVSGEHNGHKPAVLKLEASLAIIVFFSLSIFGIKQISTFALSKQSFLSEVYPAVVATLTNNGRQAINAQKLKPLAYNPVLEAAALKKADDMIAKGYFAHNSPDGKQPWDWIREEGYEYVYAGENLAINFADSIDVYQAWMNSPGHRANILNQHYTEVGIGARKTYVDGRESIIVVQMFGSPTKGYITKRNQANDTLLSQKNQVSTTSSSTIPTLIVGATTSTSTVITTNTTTTTSTSINLAVLGASTDSEEFQTEDIHTTTAFVGGIATNPKLIGLILYIFFVIIINIAVIGIGRTEYHHNHKKSIFIAVVLLGVLSLISVYFFAISPEVLLV